MFFLERVTKRRDEYFFFRLTLYLPWIITPLALCSTPHCKVLPLSAPATSHWNSSWPQRCCRKMRPLNGSTHCTTLRVEHKNRKTGGEEDHFFPEINFGFSILRTGRPNKYFHFLLTTLFKKWWKAWRNEGPLNSLSLENLYLEQSGRLYLWEKRQLWLLSLISHGWLPRRNVSSRLPGLLQFPKDALDVQFILNLPPFRFLTLI